MKLNLKGVSEGINPGDEGLENRFKAIEENQEKIVNLIRDISSDRKTDGDDGREPTSVSKSEMNTTRDLALKAVNKATEALNRVFK